MTGEVFNISDITSVKDISAAVSALHIAASLSKNEHYEIPMEIGGEEGSVSLHFVSNKTVAASVSIYTESEKLGRISGSFVYNGAAFEGSVMSDRLTTVETLSKSITGLTEVLEKQSITVSSVTFTENKNTGLSSILKEVNDDTVPANENVKRQLYTISKEFLKMLR